LDVSIQKNLSFRTRNHIDEVISRLNFRLKEKGIGSQQGMAGRPRQYGRKDPQPSLLPEGEGERIVAAPFSQVEKEWFDPHPYCPFKANASRSRTVPGQARSRLGMPPG